MVLRVPAPRAHPRALARTAPTASLLLALALAGCLGSGEVDPASVPSAALGPLEELLSEAQFGVLEGESVWVASSVDGTRLHMRLFLPDVASAGEAGQDWLAPTILVMSPYFGDDAREDPMDASSRPTYFRYLWLLDHFASRGYAVVFADVRGTGDSGGCLEQTAELQRQDGYDIVEWLAAQPWSNGRVGMFGKSYDAETQQGTALLAPPSLTTIVPVASVSGQYEWNFYDGVPFTLHTLLGNLFYMLGDGLQVPTTPEGLVQYPTRVGCHPLMLSQAVHRDGDWDDYWDSRELRNGVDGIEASVLYVHGFQDWNVRQVAIRDWYDHIPSEKRAILGQWAHDYPEENRYKGEWSRTDWRTTVHAWYDHFLLDVDNGILERLPAVQVQDSDGVWREEATWPPLDTTPVTLHLRPDGTMAPLASSTEAGADWEAPLFLRENEEAFVRSNTPVPLQDADTGEVATLLRFTSEPFADTLHMSAWPTLTFDGLLFDGLYPDPDSLTDAHFAANLYLVREDGAEPEWFNSGYLSARHRDGVREPQTVPEDERIVYELRFHPGETVLPAGGRLVLTLSGSDRWTEPEGTFWGFELWNGHLTLPVVERDWAAVTLDVPFGEPCRTKEC